MKNRTRESTTTLTDSEKVKKGIESAEKDDDIKKSISNLHITVSSVVAATVVSMSEFPTLLTPIILPLMASIKREHEEILQMKSVEALAELIKQKSKVHVLAGEDQSKLEGFISRRRSELSLRLLCEKFGPLLFDKLPKLWDCLTVVLKPCSSEFVAVTNESEFTVSIESFSVPQALINNIQVGIINIIDSSTGKSLCYGYVNVASQQEAIRAIELKNHAILNGKAIRVTWSRRDPDARKNTSSNVFVKYLAESMDNAGLEELFTTFGNILSSKVVVSEDGKSKGYGFVQFELEEAENAAIEKLNGSTIGDK
ncbi:hypothetical protein RIF29_29775 [Crotalaria pallida]|uniref:RRM domain-containing protein n=1 Tax=Crotalaria pallida TaxID=3830 RepID=A0AAN9EFK4_CROPI